MECLWLEVISSLGKDPRAAFHRKLWDISIKTYLSEMATTVVDLPKRLGDCPRGTGFRRWQGLRFRVDGLLLVAVCKQVSKRHVILLCRVVLKNRKDGGVETI